MNSINVKSHLKLLGLRVKDQVSEVIGIITSISFDLYGCVQATVNVGLDKDGNIKSQLWFDVNRLKVIDFTPVVTPSDWINFKGDPNINSNIKLLGLKVKDRITELTGVLTSVRFELNGCITAVIHPGTTDNSIRDQQWVDIITLAVLDPTPVMTPPNFEYGPVAEGKKGPVDKPLINVCAFNKS